MRLGRNGAMERFLCVVAGAAIGYLLWAAYFDIGLVPSRILQSVIEGTKSFTSWLGADTARMLALTLVVVVQALPTGLILGGIVGYILTRLNAKRWLCYSVLAWPVFAFAYSVIVLTLMERTTSPELLESLRQRRGEYALVGFIIYSTFFISVFLTNLLVNGYKTHNHPIQPTAGSGG